MTSSTYLYFRDDAGIPWQSSRFRVRRLAWKLRALEHRGFRIQVADGALVVGPKSSLTNDDAAICSNRAELIPLVTSVEITKKQAESKLTELLRQADGREFVEKTRLTGGGMAS